MSHDYQKVNHVLLLNLKSHVFESRVMGRPEALFYLTLIYKVCIIFLFISCVNVITYYIFIIYYITYDTLDYILCFFAKK